MSSSEVLNPDPDDPVPGEGDALWIVLPSKPEPRPGVCVHVAANGVPLVVYGTKTLREYLTPVTVLPATPLAKNLNLKVVTHFYPADLTDNTRHRLCTAMLLKGSGYKIHRVTGPAHADLVRRLRERCGIRG